MEELLLSGREVSLVYKLARRTASRLRCDVDLWQCSDSDRQYLSKVSFRGPIESWNHRTYVKYRALLGPLVESAKSVPNVVASVNEVGQFVAWRIQNYPFVMMLRFDGDVPFVPDHIQALLEVTWESIQEQEKVLLAEIQGKAYIEQITQDFEELTWLRSVSQFLGNLNLRNPVTELAEYSLSNLAPVLGAETVAYVPREVVDVKEDQSNMVPHQRFHLVCHGKNRLSAGTLAQLARLVSEETRDRPWICNARNSRGRLESIAGIDNLIAVPVVNGSKCYGWVIAINKRQDVRLPDDVEYCLVDSNTNMFGTFEGGLVMTAASMIAAHARNNELFEEQESIATGVIRAFINAIDAKDTYTCGHSDRVAFFAKTLARCVGMNEMECEQIYMAGLLHDIGKIGIPDSILTKPGKLTDEEYAVVKKHPEIGYSILKHIKHLEYVLPGVLHHHEAVNGKGYPHGLMGEQIPIQGRILAVADAYDAMTSDRPYRKGMPSERAEGILQEESGKTWDETIVQAMLLCIEQGAILPNMEDQSGMKNYEDAELFASLRTMQVMEPVPVS